MANYNSLSEIELAYLAGFFDGEGCISITRSVRGGVYKSPIYHLQTVLAQCNKEAIEYWCKAVGMGSVHKLTEHKNSSIGYTLRIGGRDAVKFLKMILPYLRLKKEQAEIAIKFQEMMGQHSQYSITKEILQERENIYQLMKKLKGTSSKGRQGIDDETVREIIEQTDQRREESREKLSKSNRGGSRKRNCLYDYSIK